MAFCVVIGIAQPNCPSICSDELRRNVHKVRLFTKSSHKGYESPWHRKVLPLHGSFPFGYAEGWSLLRTFEDEVHSVGIVSDQTSQAGQDMLFLAHSFFGPFRGNGMVSAACSTQPRCRASAARISKPPPLVLTRSASLGRGQRIGSPARSKKPLRVERATSIPSAVFSDWRISSNRTALVHAAQETLGFRGQS
jgi:hypothetical protein